MPKQFIPHHKQTYTPQTNPEKTAQNAQKAEECLTSINVNYNPRRVGCIYLSIIVFSSLCTIIAQNTTGQTNSVFYGLSVFGWLSFAALTVVQTCLCCSSTQEIGNNAQNRQ